jgi:hypothetical protein
MKSNELHLSPFGPSLSLRIRQLIVWITLFSVAERYNTALGAGIQYSWMGKLVPVDAGIDPWTLGSTGAVYQLTASLTSDATDKFPAEIQFAGYDTSDVKLLVAGSEVNFQGAGILDFIDDEGASLDIIGFSGQFEKSGVSIEITANTALPADTFKFSELSERPPFFASTVSATNSASSATGPYSGLASVGTPVLVVPEPDQGFMGLILFSWVAVSRHIGAVKFQLQFVGVGRILLRVFDIRGVCAAGHSIDSQPG